MYQIVLLNYNGKNLNSFIFHSLWAAKLKARDLKFTSVFDDVVVKDVLTGEIFEVEVY